MWPPRGSADSLGVFWRNATMVAALRSPTLWNALALGVAYYLGARVGSVFTPHPSPISPLWPPNAIVLGALVLTRPRTWPWLLAAVLPVHLALQLPSGTPWPMTACWFVSNSAEALIGAAVLRRLAPHPVRFDTFRRVVLFVLFGAILPAFLTSFLDVGFVRWNRWGAGAFWDLWRVRFLSDALAILTLVPAMVTWAHDGLTPLITAVRARALESTLLAAAVLMIGTVVLIGPASTVFTAPDALCLLLPVLLWSAIRFGPGGASTTLLAFTTLAICGMLDGEGPFVGGSISESVLSLQLFLILTYVPVLALSALVSERAGAEAEARRSEQVTARVNAALRASEERFAKAFWASPNAILIARQADGCIVEINERWQSQFGYSRAETVGRTIEEVGFFAESSDVDRFHALMASAGHVRELELDIRSRRGELLRAVVAAERVDLDEDASLIVQVRDITERRRAAHEVATLRQQLVHLGRVAVLGELSGALAHELNQPLTAIMANARAAQRMLRQETEPPTLDIAEMRAILDDIVADDRRAGSVIHRMRTLIRKGNAEPRDVIANDVVTEVLELAHSDLILREVSVATRLAPSLPPVPADRIQLQQVVLNLIVNACDAMGDNPPAERSLTISTRDEDCAVRLSVSDRGAGITSGSLEDVFEPFMTTKPHGLGLGLSICRSIVEAHGGRMWAVNNLGRGATFHVLLPRTRAAVPVTPAVVTRSTAAATNGGYRGFASARGDDR